MSISKYKAVIFDVDGTLLDTIDGLLFSVNYSLKQFGYEGKDPLFIRNNTGRGIKYLLKQSVPSDIDEISFKNILNLFVDHYEKTCSTGSAPFPGITELLDELYKSGIKMAEASNKIEDAVQKLNDYHFGKYHILCLGETETQRRKPAPDMILKAMEKLEVKPEETLFVGDAPTDYEAGTNAGCDVALVGWGFNSREKTQECNPVFFAETVKELRDYIFSV